MLPYYNINGFIHLILSNWSCTGILLFLHALEGLYLFIVILYSNTQICVSELMIVQKTVVLLMYLDNNNDVQLQC